ncbi:hypothetical protein ABZ890_08240 [Streptomyces sp. NPDC046984]|uniref:hypothetical protein n=1 Tax=Streptomyces sp. NPDC046984 TaxID=3155138 RepID=UPI0033FE3F57
MTSHEIQLLSLGVTLGMLLMLLVNITFGIIDDRRDLKAARAAEAAKKKSAA